MAYRRTLNVDHYKADRPARPVFLTTRPAMTVKRPLWALGAAVVALFALGFGLAVLVLL